MTSRPANHAPGCRCNYCDRKVRTAIRAAEIRQLALVRAQDVQTAANQERASKKQAAARAELERGKAAVDRAAAEIRAAGERAAADPRAARLLELRRAGKTMEEAFEIIDREEPWTVAKETK